jgi:L-malate glycosyltransferase
MTWPTVSVVIPTFNRAAWLSETVASVLAQTISPLEIIIVDDGSTDGTGELCRSFPDPVRYLYQENAGVAAARNRGAAEAKGEWLAFLDSDDLWTPDKLEVQLTAVARTGVEWSITGCELMDLGGHTLTGPQGFERAFPLFGELDITADAFFREHFQSTTISAADRLHRVYHGEGFVPLFYGNFASPATALIHADLFSRSGGFDKAFLYAEETEYFHRLAATAPMAVVTTPLLRWRVGQTVSLVSPPNVEALIRNAMRSLDQAAALGAPLDSRARTAYLAGRRSLLTRLAAWQIMVLDTKGAREALREARRAGARPSIRNTALRVAARVPVPLLRRVHAVRQKRRRARPESEARKGLRIALLLESDGPGGAERMLILLAEAMRRRGHHVIPVGPAEGTGWLAAQFRVRGFEPEVFRLRHPVDPLCVMGIARLLERHRVDVAHSHEFSMAVYGAAAARMTGVPHLITMHGGVYFGLRRRRRAALRWAVRASNRIVAVSDATREDLRRMLRVPKIEVDVVLNGVPEQGGNREQVRRELGLPDHELMLLTVGNLYRVKGHDLLIEALAAVPQTPPWRLVIAGQGEEESNLRRLVREKGIGDRVSFLGFRDDVPDLLAAADVYLMPSRSEGLPLALLEAMFAGRPIMASAVGGIPDALGQAGVLVQPEDAEALAVALREFLADEQRRMALGAAAARRAAERFGVEAMADAYEDRYRDAATRGRPQDRIRLPGRLRHVPAGAA